MTRRWAKLRRAARPTLKATGLAAGFLVVVWWLAAQLPAPWIRSVDDAGIVLGYVVSAFAAAVGIRSVPLILELRHWLRTRNRRSFSGTGENAFPMRGKIEAIVIPVSRPEQPAWILTHLQPQVVALLYTSTRRDLALNLAEEFGPSTVFLPTREEIDRTEMMLEEPHDPTAAKALVSRFLREFAKRGIPASRTFVDTTGGTVPMSIGTFLAAEEHGASSIYVLGTAAKVEGGEAIFIEDPADATHGRPIYLSDHTQDSRR